MSYWKDFDYEVEDISVAVGRAPVSIWQKDDDELFFKFDDGCVLRLCHDQTCCERVTIDDINGDWSDLIGSPLLVADERTTEGSPKSEDGWTDESSTWTFYTFRGIGGSVDVRWYGASNGYYSERVDAYLFPPDAAAERDLNPTS